MRRPLLQLEEVRTHFSMREGLFIDRAAGVIKAVDGVSFEIERGEVLGLVGESGCGKSTLARTILRLAPVTSGAIRFDGHDLAGLSAGEFRRLRPRMQMVFQDPYASLNPRMTVFDTLAEPMLVHGLAKRRDLPGRVSDLMARVGLAGRFVRKYPHEFSGGQRQRIAIARALALGPDFIIADEPVSALDVSIQAQILNLLAELIREQRLTMLFVSHDLAVVRHLSNRIAVMYLGRIVEIGPAAGVFREPAHPYTKALVGSVLTVAQAAGRAAARALVGDPPSPMNPPTGCPFHPRCAISDARCACEPPVLRGVGGGRSVACHKADE